MREALLPLVRLAATLSADIKEYDKKIEELPRGRIAPGSASEKSWSYLWTSRVAMFGRQRGREHNRAFRSCCLGSDTPKVHFSA
jgi:hypothetical protein